MNIPVLYEDDSLLIVDKPSGLLTIPTPKKEKRTLTSILDEYLKEKGLGVCAHPCHRLDRDTSGVIIYAKGKAVQKKMMDIFKQRGIKKAYIAFIHGRLLSPKGRIINNIEGLSAVTNYKVIEQRGNFAIVEAYPETGRTNQIRLHFKYIGHPVVGETRFVFRKDFQLRAKRLCLHAKDLEFKHPVSGERIYVRADLPPDMRNFLERNQ